MIGGRSATSASRSTKRKESPYQSLSIPPWKWISYKPHWQQPVKLAHEPPGCHLHTTKSVACQQVLASFMACKLLSSKASASGSQFPQFSWECVCVSELVHRRRASICACAMFLKQLYAGRQLMYHANSRGCRLHQFEQPSFRRLAQNHRLDLERRFRSTFFYPRMLFCLLIGHSCRP